LFNNMQALVQKSDQLVTRANNVLARTQNSVIVTMGNIRAITTMLRENPSAVLFGQPQQINPSDL